MKNIFSGIILFAAFCLSLSTTHAIEMGSNKVSSQQETIKVNNDGGLPITITNISDLLTQPPAVGQEVTLYMGSNLYTFDLTSNVNMVCYGYTSDYTAAEGDIIKAIWNGDKWIVTLPIGSDDITTLGKITTGTWTAGHILASSLGSTPFTITNLSNPVQFEERVVYFDVANVTLDLTSNSNMICYQRNQDYTPNIGDKVRFFYTGSIWVVNFEHPVAYYEDHTQNLGPNDTNENIVSSFTLRANDLGKSGVLKIVTLWTSAGSTKTLRVKFGATAYQAVSTTNNNMQTVAMVRNRNATNSQIGFISGSANSFNTSTSTPVTSEIDTTSDVTVSITIQKTVGTDTAAIESIFVEKL